MPRGVFCLRCHALARIDSNGRPVWPEDSDCAHVPSSTSLRTRGG